MEDKRASLTQKTSHGAGASHFGLYWDTTCLTRHMQKVYPYVRVTP